METSSCAVVVKGSEHCPGPPVTGQDLETNDLPDHNIHRELKQKDEELLKLKGEIKVYVGKIKGYQTLGHLFQESKQECARYRHKNEELANKLEFLMQRLSPDSDLLLSMTHHDLSGPSMIASNYTAPSESLPLNLKISTIDPAFSTAQFASVNALHFPGNTISGISQEPIAAGNMTVPPSRPSTIMETPDKVDAGGRSRMESGDKQSSSGSSPSFEQILSPRPSASSSLIPTVLNDVSIPQSKASEIDDEMAEEMRELNAQLLDPSNQGDGVSAELVRISVKAMKVEKQSRVQQVLLGQLSEELNQQRLRLEEKDHIIDLLKEDGKQLLRQIKLLEMALTKQPETVTKLLELSPTPETFGSMQWVQVNNQTAGAAGNETKEEVTAVSTREVELLRQIQELVSVNEKWVDYCKRIEVDKFQQVTGLQEQMSSLQRHLVEREETDVKRQREIDQMLLAAKKKTEDEEMAKEDALTELHVEKRRRTEAERKLSEFENRTEQLETNLRHLERGSEYRIESLREGRVFSSQEGLPLSNEELKTECLVLREQLTVFKEDFDQERRDREAAKAEIDLLKNKADQLAIEFDHTKRRLSRTKEELATATTENQHLKTRFNSTLEDLRTLRQQVRPIYTAPPYHPPPIPGRSSLTQQPLYQDPNQMRSAVRAPQMSQVESRRNYKPQQSSEDMYGSVQPSFPHHVRVEDRQRHAVPETRQTSYQPSFGIPVGSQTSYVLRHTWGCPACTFQNPEPRTTCEMCGLSKDTFQHLKPDEPINILTARGGASVAGPPSRQSTTQEPIYFSGSSLEIDRPPPSNH